MQPSRATGVASVLIIEDDRYVQAALRGLLEKAGHRVEIADNGRAGLDRLAAHEPDLMITDILMPEMEGLETIRAARARCPRLKIIAISGAFGGYDFLQAALAFGADKALVKPFQPDGLLGEVEACLAQG
jgi:CheY-like chemotaxis protein